MTCSSQGSVSISRYVNVNVNIVEGILTSGYLKTAGIFTTEGDLTVQDRLQYYTNLSSLQDVFNSNTETYKAGSKFFSQTPQGNRFAVGKIFTSDTGAYLEGNTIGQLSNLQTTGYFTLDISGRVFVFTFDNTNENTYVEIAAIVQTSLNQIIPTIVDGGFANATVEIAIIDNAERIKITAGNTGSSSTISLMKPLTTVQNSTTGISYTDVSGVDYFNGAVSGNVAGDLGKFQSISNGAVIVNIGTQTAIIIGLNFTAVGDYDDVATILQTSIREINLSEFLSATVTYDGSAFDIEGDTTSGSVSTIILPQYFGGSDYFAGDADSGANEFDGYDVVDFIDQVNEISNLSKCSINYFVYAWALTKELITIDNQISLAQWSAAQVSSGYGVLSLIDTNDGNVPNLNSTNNIAYILQYSNYGDYAAVFYTNATDIDYLSVALISRIMGVDLSTEVASALYKQLEGVTPLANDTDSLEDALDDRLVNRYTVSPKSHSSDYFLAGGYTSNSEISFYVRFNLDNIVYQVTNTLMDVFIYRSNINQALVNNNSSKAYINNRISFILDAYEKTGFLGGEIDEATNLFVEAYTIGRYNVTSINGGDDKFAVPISLRIPAIAKTIQLNITAINS